ncbi:efflux RND transporter periplasmic adaptor subunit [Bacillus sp. ISL-47]|uniref:efflux RND transporter periplasmic adaptor subunit n=1 Tax=Bacillus sp. ISL-47 TaxID=2819130 RepID=UPI001BEA3FB2|nr:efflux RND transporter periplasmic adaptor subunit [Bacillus sp. ISL-47]MBT2687183.1 efflux RND transporter periplasmic adaptor subunit [Bacillus sp. ISL-47]MBT2709783.1 efflux RND transporter periplasmic adaptor subunit [Pseudomonas sp. ISL-84]
MHMKKPAKITLFLLSALFVGGNLYLTEKKDSKIEKIERIEEWQQVRIGSIKNVLNKPGVVTPSEEMPIYYDDQAGAFNQFLVKPGDEISNGTDLFEYSPHSIEQEVSRLEAEKSEADNKADSVESHIRDLESLLTQAKSDADEDNPNLEAIYSLEKEISQKELEQELLENESEKLEELIDELNDRPDVVTVKSEFDGYVKEINPTLNNPVMTISSITPSVKGALNEEEIHEVTEGMKVLISSPYDEKKRDGQILNILQMPEKEPDLENETLYPFFIQLNGDESGLHSGNHVNVDIILRESANALLVHKNSVTKAKKNSYSYVLTPSGTVEKRKVKPGIKEGKKVEITEGLTPEEFVVKNAKQVQQKTGSLFTTTLEPKELEKKKVKEAFKKDWRYILRGFLSR